MNPSAATAAKTPTVASQHANPKSDIDIAQAAKMRPILDIGRRIWNLTATTRPRSR